MSYTIAGAQQALNAFFTTHGTAGSMWVAIRSSGGEITNNGGSRQEVTTSDFGSATSADPSVRASTTAWSWTASGGDLGTITGISLYSASTGGTEVWAADLDAPETVTNGNTFQLDVGAVELRLS